MSTNSNEDGGTDLRRGPWTHEEDNLLTQFISSYGEGRWNTLAKLAKLRRTGKSCRLRWLNYLKPDIKRGNLSHHEQLLILELHSKWGNRWSKIAQHLPGRTDNEIKNYWRTRVQKQARQLKVDSNSTKFLEMLRLYWMPRLREKMEQSHNQNQSSYSVSASPFSSTVESSSSSSENLKNGSNLNPPVASPPALYGNNDYSGTDKSAYPLAPETQSQFIELANEKGVGEGEGWENLELLETNCGFTGCYVEEIDWMGEELGGSCFWGSDGSVYTHML